MLTFGCISFINLFFLLSCCLWYGTIFLYSTGVFPLLFYVSVMLKHGHLNLSINEKNNCDCDSNVCQMCQEQLSFSKAKLNFSNLLKAVLHCEVPHSFFFFFVWSGQKYYTNLKVKAKTCFSSLRHHRQEASLGLHTDITFYEVNKFILKLEECKANKYLYILFSFLLFCYQGEQLCWILQLQIFSSLLGLLSTVLPFHRCNRFTVFHQVLDSKQ